MKKHYSLQNTLQNNIQLNLLDLVDFQQAKDMHIFIKKVINKNTINFKIYNDLIRPNKKLSKKFLKKTYYFEPFLTSQLKSMFKGTNAHQQKWILEHKKKFPGYGKLDNQIIIYGISDMFIKISEVKRKKVVQKLCKLDQIFVKFCEYTKCFIHQFGQNYIWKSIFIWAYRKNYPKSKFYNNAIIADQHLFMILVILHEFLQENLIKQLRIYRNSTSSKLSKSTSKGNIEKNILKLIYQGSDKIKNSKFSEQIMINRLESVQEGIEAKENINFSQEEMGPFPYIYKKTRHLNKAIEDIYNEIRKEFRKNIQQYRCELIQQV